MNQPASDDCVLRPALLSDEPQIAELIRPYVQQRKLLPRTDDELLSLIGSSFVVQCNGRIVGFSAVQIYSRKLAEVQCLAVHEDYQGKGFAKKLIDACVQSARIRGVVEVMAITSSENLFMKCGFHYALPDEKKALFINP